MLRFWLLSAFLISAWVGTALAETVATGTFKSKSGGIEASGDFEITGTRNALVLSTLDNFKMSAGPDLYVIFHPLSSEAVNEGNAKTASFRLDKLKKNNGHADYALPADFNITAWKSVLVHCWQYNHLYSAAALLETPKPTSLQLEDKGTPRLRLSVYRITRTQGKIKILPETNALQTRRGFNVLGAH